MNVPMYEPSVGIEAPQVPDLRIQPVTSAASGEDVAQSMRGLGQHIEQGAGQIAEHLIQQEKLQAREDASNASANFAQGIQNLHANLVTNTGVNADWILHGKPVPLPQGMTKLDMPVSAPIPKVDPNSYEGKASALMADALNGLTPRAAQIAQASMNRIYDSGREMIISHQLQQKQIAEKQADAASMVNNAQIYAVTLNGSATATGEAKTNLANNAEATYQEQMKAIAEQGSERGELQPVIDKNKRDFADYVAKTVSESGNVVAVKNLLSAHKADFSEEGKALLNGRMVHIGVQEIRNSQTIAAEHLLNPDQTYSEQQVSSFANKFADDNNFSPEQRTQLLNESRAEAGRQNGALMQTRQQNLETWHNGVIQDYNALIKKNPAIASDALMSKYVMNDKTDFTGYSASDMQKKSDFINQLFDDRQKAISKAMEYLNPEQQGAVYLAKLLIEARTGNTQKISIPSYGDIDAKGYYEHLLESKVAGSNMTSTQIIDYTNGIIKDFPVSSGIFGAQISTGGAEQLRSDAFNLNALANIEKTPGGYALIKQLHNIGITQSEAEMEYMRRLEEKQKMADEQKNIKKLPENIGKYKRGEF